jgi:hypothetical protein
MDKDMDMWVCRSDCSSCRVKSAGSKVPRGLVGSVIDAVEE